MAARARAVAGSAGVRTETPREGLGRLLLVAADGLAAFVAGGGGLLAALGVAAWARWRRRTIRRQPPPFAAGALDLLILGHTPLADVQRKGNWTERLARAYYNPLRFFRRSTVLIFPGKERLALALPHHIRYEERPYRRAGAWPLTRGALAYAVYLARVFSLAARLPAHLIRAHDPHLQGLAGVLAGRLLGIPCAVYIGAYWEELFGRHGEEPVFGVASRRLRRALSGHVYRRLDGTFSPVPGDPAFVASGVAPDRVHLMRQEIDLDQFAPLGSEDAAALFGGPSPRRPWILYVGRLHPEKHPADVLEAMATAPGGTILFCGDGPQRSELERLAAERGLTPRCRFLGFQPNTLVARLMVSADVIVCPLSGSALAEAAASGTPVVAYDTSWHGTLLRDGETGLLVPYRDTAALGSAVNRLLRDAALARRIGGAARAMASREYTGERIEGLMVEGLRKSYESFHARCRGGRRAAHRAAQRSEPTGSMAPDREG